MQPPAYKLSLLFMQELAGHILQQPDDLSMAIDHCIALILAPGHPLADETHHPENA